MPTADQFLKNSKTAAEFLQQSPPQSLFDPVSAGTPPVQAADFTPSPQPIQRGQEALLGGVDEFFGVPESLDDVSPTEIPGQFARMGTRAVIGGAGFLPSLAEKFISPQEGQSRLDVAKEEAIGLGGTLGRFPFQARMLALKGLGLDPNQALNPLDQAAMSLVERITGETFEEFNKGIEKSLLAAPEETIFSPLIGVAGLRAGKGLVKKASKVKETPPPRIGETPEAEPFTTRIEEPKTPLQVSEQALKTQGKLKAAGETVESVRKVVPKERIPTQLTPKPVAVPSQQPRTEQTPFVMNNANIARTRKAYKGFEKLPPPRKKGVIQSSEEAIQRGYDRDALQIATEVNKNPRPLSASEQMGGMLRIDEIQPQYLESTNKWQALKKAGKEDAAALEQQRANNLLSEMDEITRALKYSGGTEVARSLSIRRNLQPETISTILLEAERLKGERLSKPETKQVEMAFNKEANLQKRLDEMTKKWETEKARTNEAIAKQVINRQLRGERTSVKRETIRNRMTSIEKQLQGLGFRANDITGASVEALWLVGKYAGEIAKLGEFKFEGIIAEVKKKFPDFTKDDIILGITTKNPKLQGKLRSDATKRVSQLKTQAQLLLDIEKAEKGVFVQKKGRATQLPEIRKLQRQLTKLRKEAYRSEVDGAKLERALQLINELQDQLVNQHRLVKKGKSLPSEELADAQKKAQAIRKQMRTEDRLSDLNEQIRTGEFKIREKPESVDVPIELQRLQVDVRRQSRKIRDIIEDMRPRTKGDAFREVVNLTRTLKATADMSATFRQGLVPTLHLLRRGQFKKVGKLEVQAIKSFFSEFTADQIDIAIKSADHHYLREQAGLYLAERGAAKTTLREEQFMSRVAEKIPIMKHIVKASDRHMTTSLNLLRSTMFDSFLQKFPNATKIELKAWAEYVNAASGRGNVGRAADGLSNIFFAPRFAASRVQTPLRFFQNMKRPRVRNEIAKDMAAVVSVGMTALVLADLAGGDVEYLDPSNSDWGKMRFGDTRIDVWAGFQQPARVIARLTAGKITSDEDVNPFDLLYRFAAYKTAPHVGIVYQLYTGKDIVGQPVTPTETAINAALPIIVESTIEAYQREGLSKAAVTAGVEFVGFGANTFADSESRTRRRIKKLKNQGKDKEAKALGLNWNLINPDDPIREVDGFEVSKPKKKSNTTRLNPAGR